MPCNDGDSGMRAQVEERIAVQRQNTHLRERLDNVTAIACAALARLEATHVSIPNCAVEWWKKHQRLDKQRLIREKRLKRQQLERDRENAIRKAQRAREQKRAQTLLARAKTHFTDKQLKTIAKVLRSDDASK